MVTRERASGHGSSDAAGLGGSPSSELRTPGVQPAVNTPRQATFTTTKVPRFGGTTSWEQHRKGFDAIVLSNGCDDATAALQLLPHAERGFVSADVSSDIERGPGGRIVGTLWVDGQTRRLSSRQRRARRDWNSVV